MLLLCILLVVNHCKSHSGVTNFDFSCGYQNNILKTKKNMGVLHCFFKQFLMALPCEQSLLQSS